VIYEQRTYHCCPTRLPALQERFANHTLAFFRRHGIRPLGFWTTLVGEDNHKLTYVLEWIAARGKSEAEKPIVARIACEFLAPCAFFDPVRSRGTP